MPRKVSEQCGDKGEGENWTETSMQSQSSERKLLGSREKSQLPVQATVSQYIQKTVASWATRQGVVLRLDII